MSIAGKLNGRYRILAFASVFSMENEKQSWILIGIPLVVLMLLELVVHLLLYCMMAVIVMVISGKRKKTMEVYVYTTLCIVVPLLLCFV